MKKDLTESQMTSVGEETFAELVVRRLTTTADELMCRVSVHKLNLLTHLGKRVLPQGYWGTARQHVHGTPHVYLTFDDGPHPHTTPALLELLAEAGVKATFFLIGANCARYPELVKAIHEGGHAIGNHTYNHVVLPTLSEAELARQIEATNELIASITGQAPQIFRPPFGWMTGRAGRVLRRLQMTPVYWGCAPEDWLNPGSHRVIRRVMWKVADGTLIVLHEGGSLAEQTITAAKEIISRCKSQGYDFSKVNVRAGLQTPDFEPVS